jgi:hypothetical protein
VFLFISVVATLDEKRMEKLSLLLYMEIEKEEEENHDGNKIHYKNYLNEKLFFFIASNVCFFL